MTFRPFAGFGKGREVSPFGVAPGFFVDLGFQGGFQSAVGVVLAEEVGALIQPSVLA
jgi:hypothetical protein